MGLTMREWCSSRLLFQTNFANAKIFALPNDIRKIAATNFSSLNLSNISYTLCLEADEKRPRMILATDRNLVGFNSPACPTISNCFILTSWIYEKRRVGGAGFVTARTASNMAMSDGSVNNLTTSV